jgi:hypothetical protein
MGGNKNFKVTLNYKENGKMAKIFLVIWIKTPESGGLCPIYTTYRLGGKCTIYEWC